MKGQYPFRITSAIKLQAKTKFTYLKKLMGWVKFVPDDNHRANSLNPTLDAWGDFAPTLLCY
jgi:hypothetical protein